jgi:hydrogenase nickel incorporation protein HypA/HybF
VHELSISQSVVEICTEQAAGRRVTVVVLEIGDLSGVVPDAVEFCFEACTQGTPLEGARLEIRRVAAVGRCPGCGAEFPVRTFFDPCPACNAYGIELLSGEELRVRELEVE